MIQKTIQRIIARTRNLFNARSLARDRSPNVCRGRLRIIARSGFQPTDPLIDIATRTLPAIVVTDIVQKHRRHAATRIFQLIGEAHGFLEVHDLIEASVHQQHGHLQFGNHHFRKERHLNAERRSNVRRVESGNELVEGGRWLRKRIEIKGRRAGDHFLYRACPASASDSLSSTILLTISIRRASVSRAFLWMFIRLSSWEVWNGSQLPVSQTQSG